VRCAFSLHRMGINLSHVLNLISTGYRLANKAGGYRYSARERIGAFDCEGKRRSRSTFSKARERTQVSGRFK
jgi:hypothetical protein